jgi:uncharacterized Fe-S center protein
MAVIINERGTTTETLRRLLASVSNPFAAGDRVGIKIHWGERGNYGFIRLSCIPAVAVRRPTV